MIFDRVSSYLMIAIVVRVKFLYKVQRISSDD